MITLGAHVVRRLGGFVQVEVVDVDGDRHRFREKAAAVVAPEHPDTRTADPVPVQVPCLPVRRTNRYRRPEVHNEVVPVSRATRGEKPIRVRREQLTWTAPAVYSDLSVAARQAAALVTFRRWLDAVGVRSPELETTIEHLWQFPTVEPSTFDAWYDSRWDGELEPEALREIAAVVGVREDRLDEALDALVEITHGGLFSGITSTASLRELEAVGRFTARHGVPLAPAALFVDDLWIDDDWGRPSGALVARWRALA